MRIREGGFTKIERVIRAQNNECRDAQGDHGEEGNPEQGFEKVQTFLVGIVAVFLVVREVIKEEVQEAVNADHVTDIVVAEEGQRQKYGIHFEFSVLDQRFHAKGDERKPHQGVHPHGVVLLHNGVAAQSVAHGEENDREALGIFHSLLHVVSKGGSADRGLEQEEGQKCFQHTLLGEKANQIGQRTGKIVGVHTHKFTAQRTAEGVQKAGVSFDRVSQGFKEPDVLGVQVKNQHASVSEGMDISRGVDQIHHDRRNQSAKEEKTVFTEKAFFLFLFFEKIYFFGKLGYFIHGFSFLSFPRRREEPVEWLFPI